MRRRVLRSEELGGIVQFMEQRIQGRRIQRWRTVLPIGRAFILLLLFCGWVSAPCEAPAAAVSAFNDYAGKVESRLAEQHRTTGGFLAPGGSSPQTDARLRKGELIIEQLTPSSEAHLPGALLHHWRGTAFVPDATAADFERLMKDVSGYPRKFSPQVMKASILTPGRGGIKDGVPDQFTALMRVRQHHVITVVMDTTYDVKYGRLDARHGYSISRTTKISEIGSAGTAKEHALTDSEEHGFLWRMNTYWSYEERDGGLYMQVESITLTRGIPVGLRWAVRPYVESVPRESLEFTLRSACDDLKK